MIISSAYWNTDIGDSDLALVGTRRVGRLFEGWTIIQLNVENVAAASLQARCNGSPTSSTASIASSLGGATVEFLIEVTDEQRAKIDVPGLKTVNR